MSNSTAASTGVAEGINMVTMAQIATLMLSIVEALFFGYNLTINKFRDPVWEPFWVTIVEVICYSIQLGSGSFRFAMADGALLNVVSPAAWCLACPVAMSFMMRIAWPEASPRTTLALIMNLEAVILIGLISGMTQNWDLKVPLFVIAALLYTNLCVILLKGMFFGAGDGDRPREAKNILLFFMATWMIFPIVWLLGPNMTNAWSYELTLTFFAFGDIFAKNIFTYIGYKYTINLLQAEEDALLLENGEGVEMLENGKMVKPNLNRKSSADKIFAKQANPMSNVDPLLIARIIEHLGQGETVGQQQTNPSNKWGTVKQAVLSSDEKYATSYRQGGRMSGVAKDHGESIDFTVLTVTVETLTGGAKHTVIRAKNDTNEYPLEFTVMQDDAGKVVFCDVFESIQYRISDTTSEKSYHPALMPATPTGQNQANVFGTSDELFALPMERALSQNGSLSRKNSFSSNDGGALNNNNKESFTMFPLPKDLDVYAWKEGVSKALKIKSSKSIELGDGREGNTILAVDNNGEMDAFVIVTFVNNSGNRQVMSCKYDQLTLGTTLSEGLFPAISGTSSNSGKNKGA